jgi:hypothetical protein
MKILRTLKAVCSGDHYVPRISFSKVRANYKCFYCGTSSALTNDVDERSWAAGMTGGFP